MRGFSRKRFRRKDDSRRSIFSKRPATMELLEDRRMLAIDTGVAGGIPWTFSNGSLTIDDSASGTDAILLSVEQVQISPTEWSPPTIAVNGDPLQINGVVGDIIAADLITQLSIFGGSGHDVIDASALTTATMPNLDRGGVRIHSGLGRDGVVGSHFDDYIDAGPGKDIVYGRGGNDHLIGGDDLDSLFGEDGDDLLDPGNRLGIQKPDFLQVFKAKSDFSVGGGALHVRFNQEVLIGAAALVLETDGGQSVSTSAANFTYSPIDLTATWEFPAGSLAASSYTYAIPSAAVVDFDGEFLDGDLDGEEGGTFRGNFKIDNPISTGNPKVLDVKTNDGEEKYSKLNSVTVQFDADVGQSISLDDLTLENTKTQELVAIESVEYDASTNTATWTAAEEVTDVGYYVATLDGSGVSTGGGNHLAGNFAQAGTLFKQSLLVTHDGDLNLDGHVSDQEANAVIANLGSSDADWLAGDVDGDGIIAPADALTVLGNAGLNVLNAGESERLEGGPGNDTYSFETPIGKIPVTIDDLESGVDTVDFSRVADFANGNTGIVFDLSQGVSTVSVTGVDQWDLTVVGDVENVIGSSYDDVLIGNAQANLLLGGGGNDELQGGIGDDQLVGGLGDDRFVYAGDFAAIDFGTDTIVEVEGEGRDTLDFQLVNVPDPVKGLILDLGSEHGQTALISGSSVLAFTPMSGAFVEDVIGTDADDTISGNSLNNILVGGLGNDLLFGRAGDDEIRGGEGSDTLRGGLGFDEVYGGAGFDDPEIIDNLDPGHTVAGDSVIREGAGFLGSYVVLDGITSTFAFDEIPMGQYELLLTWPTDLELTNSARVISFSNLTQTFPQYPGASGVTISDAEWYSFSVDDLSGSAQITFNLSGDTLLSAADAALLRPTAIANPTAGTTIQGVKFDDQNLDGQPQDEEPLLEDWMIFVDSNQNGLRDGNETFRVTDEDGHYSFQEISGNSNYNIREVNQPGWRPINPSIDAGGHQVVHVDGEIITADFGNAQFDGTILLESDEFLTEIRQQVEFDGRQNISIKLDDLTFDSPLDSEGMGDAFELALVREDGTSWVSTLGYGLDSFYNQTEGQETLSADGVSFGREYVTVDVSTLPAGETGTLIARLVNNDDDSGSRVGVSLTQDSDTLWGVGTQGYDKVDIFFLFDDTSSADGSISEFRNSLRGVEGNDDVVVGGFSDIRSDIENEFPNIDFGYGVGRFEGYGYRGDAGDSAYGRSRPFILNQPIISTDQDMTVNAAIQQALSNDRSGPGQGGPDGDGPETLIEALFQLATGAGYDGDSNGSTNDSGPIGTASAQILGVPYDTSGDVPEIPFFLDNGSYLSVPVGSQEFYQDVRPPEGKIGAAGFREGALPVIIVLTDDGTKYRIPDGGQVDWIAGQNNTRVAVNEFKGIRHHGFQTGEDIVQVNVHPISGVPYPDHLSNGTEATIQQAIDALVGIDARVIGLGNNLAEGALSAVANATGTFLPQSGTGDAQPAFFNIPGAVGVAGFADLAPDGLPLALNDIIGHELDPQPNTLFEFGDNFDSTDSATAYGQVQLGDDNYQITDMAADDGETALFIANKPDEIPRIFSLNLKQATTGNLNAVDLGPIRFAANQPHEFNPVTDEVTGLAIELTDTDLTFFLSVNHAVSGDSAPIIYEWAQFSNANSAAVQLTDFPIYDPPMGPTLLPVTDIQSLSFDGSTLYAVSGFQRQVLKIDQDGSWSYVDTSIGFTEPSDIAVDPFSGKILVAVKSNSVAVKLHDATRLGDGPYLANLTNRDRIARIDGLSFSTARQNSSPNSRIDYIQGRSFDGSELVDVSAWFTSQFHVSSFNDDQSNYFVELSLDTLNPGVIRDTLAVGFRRVDNPTVTLSRTDGVAPDGTRLQNISHLAELDPNGFVSDQFISDIWLGLDNPLESQFDYELAIYGKLNDAPEFTSTPRGVTESNHVIDVPIGSTFTYQPTAVDENGDHFFFSVTGPEQLVLETSPDVTGTDDPGDPPTTSSLMVPDTVVFEPTAAMLNEQFDVIVTVEDDFGAFSNQSFALRVIDPPANRRPRFEAPYPTTVAYVGQEYRFKLNAFDPDGDDLKYFEVSGPAGEGGSFNVDEDSGWITWTPSDDAVDQTFTIDVKVEEAATTQLSDELSFNVFVAQQNQDPKFTTVPGSSDDPQSATYDLPTRVVGSSEAAEPKQLNVSLADGQELITTVSVNADAVPQKADVVFVIDRTSSMALQLVQNRGAELLQDLQEQFIASGYEELDENNNPFVPRRADVRYGVTVYDQATANRVREICFDATTSDGNCSNSQSSEVWTKDTSELQSKGFIDGLVQTDLNPSSERDPYAAIASVIRDGSLYNSGDAKFREGAAQLIVLITAQPSDVESCDSSEPCTSEAVQTILNADLPHARIMTIAPTPYEVRPQTTDHEFSFSESTLFDEHSGDWSHSPTTWADDGVSPELAGTIFASSASGQSPDDPIVAFFRPNGIIASDFVDTPYPVRSSAMFELIAGRDQFMVFDPRSSADGVLNSFNYVGLDWSDDLPISDDIGIDSGGGFEFLIGRAERGVGGWTWNRLNTTDDLNGKRYFVSRANDTEGFFELRFRPLYVDNVVVDLFFFDPENEDAENVIVTSIDSLDAEIEHDVLQFSEFSLQVTSGGHPLPVLQNSTVGVATRVGHEPTAPVPPLQLKGFINGLYQESEAYSYPDSGEPRSIFSNNYGVWDDLDGPTAIGVGSFGHKHVSYIPTEGGEVLAIESGADLDRVLTGFDEQTRCFLPDGIADDPVIPVGFCGSSTSPVVNPIGAVFAEPFSSNSSTLIVDPPIYDYMRSDVSELARRSLGAAFDLELILNDSPSNDYIAAFAKAFTRFITPASEISLTASPLPPGGPVVEDVFIDDSMYPIHSVRTEAGGEVWHDFEIKLRGNGQVINGLDLEFVDTAVSSLLGTIPVSIGAAYEYRAYAVDPDDDTPLTFRLATELPELELVPLVTDFDPNNGASEVTTNQGGVVVRYSPNYEYLNTPGSVPIELVVSDGLGGRDDQNWVLNFDTVDDSAGNTAPTITHIGASTVDALPDAFEVAVGRALSLNVTAVDLEDQEDLQYYLIGSGGYDPIPDGMRINRFTGVITWAPGPQHVNADLNLGVGVHDRRVRNEVPFGVRVLNPTLFNNAPVLAPLPDLTFDDNRLSFEVHASDEENDPLTFSVVGLSGAVVESHGNSATVIWDAPLSEFFQYESFTFLVLVSDGQKSDQRQRRIRGSNQNVGPVFITPPELASAVVGQTYSARIRAIDPFSNDDAASSPLPITMELVDTRVNDVSQTDNLGFTAYQPVSGGNTLVLSGTVPGVLETGNVVEFDIRATDNDGAKRLETYSLEILESRPNTPPRLDSPTEVKQSRFERLVYRVDVSDEDGDAVHITPDLDELPNAEWDPGTRLVTWTPRVSNSPVGEYTMSFALDDQVVGSPEIVPVTVTLTGQTSNRRPSITQVQVPDAVVGRTYRFKFEASDPDGDILRWNLHDQSAKSMAIDYETGEFVWTPSFLHLGMQTVDIQVRDSRGAVASLPISINVRAANLPPIVRDFAPPSFIRVGDSDYQVDAFDRDGGPEPISYRLVGQPTWMTVTPDTGVINFTAAPDGGTSGDVTLIISDGESAVDVELTFSVTVDDVLADVEPPRFLNSPPRSVLLGTNGVIFKPIVDPETAVVTVDEQDGFTFVNGELRWNTTNLDAGLYLVKLTATNDGVSKQLQAPIVLSSRVVGDNAAPVFVVPSAAVELSARPNSGFSYAVLATDQDGDHITYSVDNEHFRIDELGVVTFNEANPPSLPATFMVTATDEFRASTSSEEITVVASSSAGLSLTASALTAFPGQQLSFAVGTSDADYFSNVELEVSNSNVAVPLNSSLIGSHTFDRAGTFTVVARGTAPNGNPTDSDPLTIRVYDNESYSPDLFLYENGISYVRPTLENVTTINYEVDFPVVYSSPQFGDTGWKLTLTPKSASAYDDGYVIDQGVGSIEGTKQVDLDPRDYPEGTYELRLSARTVTTFPGNEVYFEQKFFDVFLVNPNSPIEGDSIGNFSLSFTDLSIPVGGIPLTVQRTYDGARAETISDFGHGWRLELRDTQIRVNGTRQYDDFGDSLPNYVPQQTLLRIALPGGEKQSFLFDVAPAGLPQFNRFEPEFLPRPGTTSSLRVVGNPYVAGGSTELTTSLTHPNDFVLVSSADPFKFYNPANLEQHFVLTTADRSEYWIDSVTGQIDKIVDVRGHYLEFEDTRITSYSPGDDPYAGVTPTAELMLRRQGPNDTISEIIDPDGKSIVYEIDQATRELLSVTNRENETTRFAYNIDGEAQPVASSKPHLLTRIYDSRGVKALQATFQTDLVTRGVMLTGIEDAKGHTANFSYAFDEEIDGATYSVETIKDAQGYPTDILRDIRGNTVRTIQYGFADDGDPTQTPVEMHQTVFVYDDNDYLTGTSKVITHAYERHGVPAGARDLGILKPEFESEEQWVSRSEYDSVGNLNWQSNATDETTSYAQYDRYGSPAIGVDPAGTVTDNYIHDGEVLPVKSGALLGTTVTDVHGGILSDTSFDYHQYTGQLIATRNGGELTSDLQYNDEGRLSISYSPGSGQTGFLYDVNGNQEFTWVQSEDPDGAPRLTGTQNVYDAEGRVTEVQQYEKAGFSTGIANATLLWTTSTTYNSLGQVEKTTDRFGNETTNEYDITGNLIETRTEVRSDDHPGRIWMTSRTVYDESGRAIAVSDPFLTNEQRGLVTDPADLRITVSIYDDLGRVVKTERRGGVGIDLNPDDGTTLEGDFTTATSGDGILLTSSSTNYRADGLVNSSTSTIYAENGSVESQNTTWFAYDLAQRQTHSVQIVDVARDDTAPNLPLPEQDISAWIVQDSEHAGEIISGYDDLLATRTLYDNAGRQEHTIDASGNRTTFVYDGLGRVVETQVYNPDPTILGSDERFILTSTTGYDLQGRRDVETDVLGQLTNYAYGIGGRLEGVTLPQAYWSDGSTGGRHQSTYSYGFDDFGNQVSITDPNDGITTFVYDHRGRTISRTLPSVSGEPGVEEMFYNDAPLLDVSELPSSVAMGQLEYQVSSEGVVTAYRYDNTPLGGGQMVQQLFYAELSDYTDGELPLESISYKYDPFGRQVETTFVRENSPPEVTKNVFDADGRLTKIDSEQGVINYEYDNAGRLIRTYTDSGVTDTHYEYDNLGRLVAVGDAASDANPYDNANRTQYFYDVVGNLDAVRIPSGDSGSVTTDYQYDALHRLLAVVQFVDSDDNNVLSGAETPIESFEYRLREDGKRIGVTETRGDETTEIDWVYDEMGRLAAEAYNGESDDFIAVYQFDKTGNRTAKLVDETVSENEFAAFLDEANLANVLDGDAPNTWAGFGLDEETAYEFDARDRLTRELHEESGDPSSNTTTFYEYEETQQIGKQVYGGVHADPPATGQPQQESLYGYNLQGRQSEVEVTDHQTPSNSSNSEYKFNADGVRVSQTVDDNETTFLVDANNPTGYAQVLESGDDTSIGQVAKSYAIGHDVIAQTDHDGSASTVYFMYDGHGSTRALVDDSGMIIGSDSSNVDQVFDYDAYGNLLNMATSQAATTLLYSGEFTDIATGQQYLRARFYDPATGRFNRLDPFAGLSSDPTTLHKYVYTYSDPIQGIDPTGEFTVVQVQIGISIGSTITGAGIGYAVGGGRGALIGGGIGLGVGVSVAYFWGAPIQRALMIHWARLTALLGGGTVTGDKVLKSRFGQVAVQRLDQLRDTGTRSVELFTRIGGSPDTTRSLHTATTRALADGGGRASRAATELYRLRVPDAVLQELRAIGAAERQVVLEQVDDATGTAWVFFEEAVPYIVQFMERIQ